MELRNQTRIVHPKPALGASEVSTPGPRSGRIARAGLDSLDRVFLEGTSPIDLGRLNVADPERARQFMASYGYDLNSPEDLQEVDRIQQQAIDFLKQHLCPPTRPGDLCLTLPREVEIDSDVTQLLIWASRSRREEPLQPWACAVLRVMHAVHCADRVVKSPHSREIVRQVLDPYRAHIHPVEGGGFCLGIGEQAVPLHRVEFRQEKARDSLILKLLHKPDNLPQSVFDQVGIRLVTYTRHDALRVLRYIRRHHLANVAHLTPGRSRNTLLDDARVKTGSKATHNPHSSAEYRSVQFTCQRLIKVTNPLHELTRRVCDRLQPGAEREAFLEELSRSGGDAQVRFLFPYEVQILDVLNQQKSEFGDSSHITYRRRQLRAVRARVFPGLLTTPPDPSRAS